MPFKNPEVEKAWRRKWSQNRRRQKPGVDSPRTRAWEKRNPDKRKAQKRRYYQKHRQRLLKKQKAYYKANTAKCHASMRKHTLNRRGALARNSDNTATAFILFVRSKKQLPCYYCGNPVSGKKAHIDHVIAVSKRGNHASQNLCASCPDCNLRKGSKLPSELTFIEQPLLNL